MKKNRTQFDRSTEDIPEVMEMNAVTAECLTENSEGKEEKIITRIELADNSYTGTYEEFIQNLTDDIKELGYTNEDMDFHKTEKGMDVLDIQTHVRGGTVKLRAYPGDLFQHAKEAGYDSTVKNILDQIQDTEDDMEEMNLSSIQLSGTYEELKENLIIRPLNFTRYACRLKTGIYHRHGDVTLALYLVLADFNGKLMTRMIERRELEEWKMSDQSEEIFAMALKQTARRYPAVVLSQKSNEKPDLLNGDYQREDIVSARGTIQLSSSIGTNGAVALFYPGVSGKIAELMHGNYAAVFLNTSDVMILKPDSPYLNDYMQFASRENAYGEMLSGEKYLFDKEGKLMNA